nr:Zinc finger domain containing protein [Haemonchus contortus]
MGVSPAGQDPATALDVYRGRSPGPYAPGTSWNTWWRLFQNFLALRRVTDEGDKRLIFLQEVGASNYELLESLLQGKEPEMATMVELKQAMEQQFQPKKLLVAERFGLMSKSQKAGQTLQEYYAEVQKAAGTCGFEKIKDMRDAMVAMVFIGGLASVETRKRLLEREELTSKEVLEMAEAVERVGKNAPHLKQGVTKLEVAAIAPREPRLPPRARVERRESSSIRKAGPTNTLARGRSRTVEKRTRVPPSGPQQCWVCGGRGHIAKQCFFKGKAFCNLCSRPGHLPKVCRMRQCPTKASRQIH